MPSPFVTSSYSILPSFVHSADNRRKADSLDSPTDSSNNQAKKQRSNVPINPAAALMLPPPANYTFVDHSNIFNLNPHNNNMAAVNGLSQHPATSGMNHFFNPTSDSTLLQGSYELTNTSQQVTSEPHSMFFAPSAFPVRDSAISLSEQLPTVPGELNDEPDSGKKFASLQDFSESDSSEDEKA